MISIEANLGKMEAQLKQWGAKLDDLVTKADEAGTEAKADYQRRIGELKAKHQVAQAKFDELKAAGIDKWATFKDGIDRAWTEVEGAYKKLTS